MGIDVSILITVYNKEPYLRDTIESLLAQRNPLTIEYIFVDDVSTDRSIQVIEDATRGVPNVIIIRNTENRGPSARVNQGFAASRGEFIQCIDSDDIMLRGVSERLRSLLIKYDADMIYGGWYKLGYLEKFDKQKALPERLRKSISDDPMAYSLGGRVVRMNLMATREAFERSGGCDERIFVQDESLALHLAEVSKRMIQIHAPLVWVPPGEDKLSRHITQSNHDRFLANYYEWIKYSQMGKTDLAKELYRRCVSATWKQKRYEDRIGSHFSKFFLRYCMSKWPNVTIDAPWIEEQKAYFLSRPEVRRISS
jgi:glycosyltransferase involved in cell wall biosynthesis